MTRSSILRDDHFTQIAEAQVDDKRRLTLKKLRKAGKTYRIYENAIGQIILDPVVTIPASEAWLFQNPQALASVKRGLRGAAEGKVRKLPSLAKHADEPLE